MSWLSQHGGKIENPTDDLVAQLSSLGGGGKFPANAERDFHRKLRRTFRSVRAKIHMKPVRLCNPSTGEIGWENFPILLPEELLKALWTRGEKTFRKCLFGDISEKDCEAYWKHIDAVCPWFTSHPAKTWHCKGKLASITTYGDEVRCYKNSECGVISVTAWCAELAWKNAPLLRYYPIACWSEHCECEFTYNDVLRHVIESLKEVTSPNRIWPWTQSGYLLAMIGAQGDLKWITERMGMHNFRMNEFCSRCHCVKNHPQDVYLTLPNFAYEEGAHQPRDYSSVDLAERFSPLFSMPGLTVENVQHDIMHSQYLGTGKTLNGGGCPNNCSFACKWCSNKAMFYTCMGACIHMSIRPPYMHPLPIFFL